MFLPLQCSPIITAEDTKKQKHRRPFQEKIDKHKRKI